MLGANIQIKLVGIHKTAFHAFCERVGITNSRHGITKLIEMLPEFERLTNLHLHNPKNNNNEPEIQDKIDDKEEIQI